MANQPTPYAIALATLIALHCEENSPLYNNGNYIDPDFNVVESFLQCLMLQNDEATSPRLYATPIRSLLIQFENCGVSLETANRYKSWLEIAGMTIDSLMDLITTLQRSVAEGSIDASSSNGIFIRSVCLGFDELSFEYTVQLWKELYKELNESADLDSTLSQDWTLSSDQIEDSLRKQCANIENVKDNTSSLQRQLQNVMDHNPELPSSHFMRFVLCLEAGERVGAIDALHKYVDYVLINHEQHPIIDGTAEDMPIQRNEEILQFAAILKTALHSSFGDHAMALAATEEAVRVAQQSQDTACVAFALGWLAVHSSDSPNASQLIQRCIQRATEGNLRSLAAGASLSLASTSALLRTENILDDDQALRTVHAWHPWSDAFSADPTLNAEADASRWDRPTYMTHLHSGIQAMQILGRQRLVAAGIWESFGQTGQSGLSSLLALHNHGNHLSAQDINISIQNIVRRSLLGSSHLISDQFGGCGNLMHNYFTSDNHSNILKLSGINCLYGDAMRHILSLRETHHLPTEGIFHMEIALVAHEWSVRRGDLLHAETLINSLESHLNPRIPNVYQLSVDVSSQKALLRSRQGRFDEAKQLLQDEIDKLKTSVLYKESSQVARLLIQKSLLELESNSEHQYTSSDSSLLECLALTKENNMYGLHATSLSILAQVHLKRGNHKKSAAVIRAVLPSLIQQEHVWFQAEAYLTLGKCILKRSQHLSESDPTRSKRDLKKILYFAMQKLQRSEQLFRRCQDCLRLKEVYYLLARVYNSLPNCLIERNEASKNFIRMSQYLVTASSDDACQFMSSLRSTAALKFLIERPIPVVNIV